MATRWIVWQNVLKGNNNKIRHWTCSVRSRIVEHSSRSSLKFCLLFLTAGMLQKRTCTVYNCSHIKQANKKSSPRSQLYGFSLSDFDTNKSMLLKFQFPWLLPTEIENVCWPRIKFRDFHFLLWPWRIFVFPELWRSCDAQQWLHYDTIFFSGLNLFTSGLTDRTFYRNIESILSRIYLYKKVF